MIICFYFYNLFWGWGVYLTLFTWRNLVLNMSSAHKVLVTCMFGDFENRETLYKNTCIII